MHAVPLARQENHTQGDGFHLKRWPALCDLDSLSCYKQRRGNDCHHLTGQIRVRPNSSFWFVSPHTD